MTEQELVYGLRNGEELAFKELVQKFQDRVFNTALGLLQQASDAEDIAQEVFIQVYKSIHQFKEQSLLSTWIYSITTTKCLDHLRRSKRKKRFGFVTSLFGTDNMPVYEPGEFNHPGVQLDRKEDARQLFQLVNTLPGNQRTAFILNKVEELSYREIAAILNTTESAVDSLLQRAKQSLRKKINELPP
ncbi:MAG: RNA polymerase sigma factor [Bacteroidetes bacterium]|nr:RNA polymerase sigma factor [Bacteroidota bacterium]